MKKVCCDRNVVAHCKTFCTDIRVIFFYRFDDFCNQVDHNFEYYYIMIADRKNKNKPTDF